MKKRTSLLMLILLLTLSAQAAKGYKDLVTIQISPDHDDWNYKVGQDALFKVSLFFDQQPIKEAKIYYEAGPEQLTPFSKDSLQLKNGISYIRVKGLFKPGFLSCRISTKIDGFTYSNTIGVAYEAESIAPTTQLPDDFMEFWQKQINQMSKIPMTSQMTLIADQCTPEVNVYQVRLSHYRKGCYLYGILCIPVKEGKYPAVLKLPGAGVAKHKGDVELARQGIITFQIGIHGIPLDMNPEAYENLRNGALANYSSNRLDSREDYYFNRVYLGCVRANDFITSLPQYDGENLAAYGGSQGGALTLVTGALDKRVKYLAAFYPALCDLTAYTQGRAGGWPHFRPQNCGFNLNQKQIETSRYYDVVNFARFITIPGFYSWGYSDETCPPTSYYAAYNQIKGDKTLYLLKETGHWRYPEQNIKVNQWLINKLTVRK